MADENFENEASIDQDELDATADETTETAETAETAASQTDVIETPEEIRAEAKRAKRKDPFVVTADARAAIPIINTGFEAVKQALPTMKGAQHVVEEVEEEAPEAKAEEEIPEAARNAHIYALRTTANREDQVLAFVASNAARKKLGVYSAIAPHGMRGYIFVEAADRHEAEQAAFGVPYAKGLLPNEIQYQEIEHMLEQVKKDVNIQKNDIAEILSGPFKREKCKIARVDKIKEEVVVELLEAAVPIPITLKIDAVKVIRRDDKEK